MNIRRNTLGLLISTALCLAFLLLEHLGMGLYTITETHTLAALAAIVFGVFALYFAALIATSFSVKIREGSPGEVIMLAGLYRVVTVLVLIGSIVYVQGKLGVFASFFSLFGGMLLGWSLQAPVSGLAAWVMVTLKRPFRIGDRAVSHFRPYR